MQDGITGEDIETTARTARAKSRHRLAATAKANPPGAHRNEVCYCQRSALIQDLVGQVSGDRCTSTGIWRDQMESTWVFTYWEAGDKVTRAIDKAIGFYTSQLHPD
jgi:hypothetical protein